MIGKNNPFNIRYSGLNNWKGQIGKSCGFCDFESIKYGIRACAYLLLYSYRKRGVKSYVDIINVFAPPSENDTKAYIKFVVPFGKSYCDCPETLFDYALLMQKMARFESNYYLEIGEIMNVFNEFHLKPYEKKCFV